MQCLSQGLYVVQLLNARLVETFLLWVVSSVRLFSATSHTGQATKHPQLYSVVGLKKEKLLIAPQLETKQAYLVQVQKPV